jgi:ParB family chromosome partitioning protein
VKRDRGTAKLNIKSLAEFSGHPFKPYEGQRLADMAESIRVNGVIVPIVVRPLDEGKYEILSGHNRVRAAREAGLTDVPAVVHERLSDADALLIVTETNLLQRSFADMCHSERAAAIGVHYGAIKGRGYRSDLIGDVEKLTSEASQNGTLPRSLRGLEKVYGISKNTIARYLRVNKLIADLKHRLDDGQINMSEAIELSYLREGEQEMVSNAIMFNRYQISSEKARKLREMSAERPLKDSDIAEMLFVGNEQIKNRMVRFDARALARYFGESKSSGEIAEELLAALAFYRENAAIGVSNESAQET